MVEINLKYWQKLFIPWFTYIYKAIAIMILGFVGKYYVIYRLVTECKI